MAEEDGRRGMPITATTICVDDDCCCC